VLALFAALSAGVLAASARSASAATVPAWSGIGAQLPANADPSNLSGLMATSCPAPGNCVAVGTYASSGNGLGFIDSQSGGTWGAVAAPVPAGSNANPSIDPVSVDCPVVGSCAAVGIFRDTSSHNQGLLLTLANGSWTAAQAPLPANVNTTDPGVILFSVSCGAPGSCVAVGQYHDASNHDHGLLLTLANGSWSDSEAPLPGDASPTNPNVALYSVSCVTAASCTAVGDYHDSGSNGQGLVETLSGGAWSVHKAPLPSDASANPTTTLTSVSCTAVGTCTIVGEYIDLSTNAHAVVESLSDGVLTDTKAPLPADGVTSGTAPSPGSVLYSVSCPSTGYCVAAGGYVATTTTANGIAPLIETLSSGTWTPSTGPGSFDPSAATILSSVSCSWPGSCAILGSSASTGSSAVSGVIETLSQGTWSETPASLPSDASVPNQVQFGFGGPVGRAISCVAGTCALAGSYDTASGFRGFIDTFPNLSGYQLGASDGGIFAFNAPFLGSMGATHLNQPIVGIAAVPDSGGYYEVASDGGIFSFGASFFGSMGGQHLNQPVVGIAFDSRTGGYYEVASDGGIFAFNAPFFGSMGGQHLNKPIVGIAFDSATGGYYEVASDGGIFSFNAPFEGSMGAKPLNKPIVGMAVDSTTGGYYEVASDGGIFSFGAPFQGSMGANPLNKPLVGMAYDFATGGYYEVASDGGIFSFNAPFHGSMGANPLNKPVVGMAYG
jgi:hypothetical protein